MATMFFASGLVLIFIGYFLSTNKDWMWERTVNKHRRRGLSDSAIQRTPEWESQATAAGVSFLIFGVMSFIAWLLW